MPRVLLKSLRISNLGPIKGDQVSLNDFTYFVGRNNSGKSHYLKAIELLLATRSPSSEEIKKLQNDKALPIVIEGDFSGVEDFTALVGKSNHKTAIDSSIANGILTVVRNLDPVDSDNCFLAISDQNRKILNPAGLAQNLLKVLPDAIVIEATADTSDELKGKSNTAISKLKKEVLGQFMADLRTKSTTAFTELDDFLHSQDEKKRSPELSTFEKDLKDELEGEFAEVIPTVEFALPDEEVIAAEMKIFLDDGYRSEVEQKGHGLQRATLLALLRLLAKQGQRYRERPAPMFLIGELETFLHPYAQTQLGEALAKLVNRYQIVTTTHSPFIISPANIEGYKRVTKRNAGTTASAATLLEAEWSEVKRHLEWRGNLEGLFADRVVLLEGKHDETFFDKLREIFEIEFPPKKLTLFVKASGRKQLRSVRRFYFALGFDDVLAVADLDYIFCKEAKNLLEELQLDPLSVDRFRKHIHHIVEGDPNLQTVMLALDKFGEPAGFRDTIEKLENHKIFLIRRGSPEFYCKSDPGNKDAISQLASEKDLIDPEFLKQLITRLALR
jgi:predicted ATP-dependent endonuclease of OLD family